MRRLIGLFVFITVVSCQNNELESAYKINLKAPSGVIIATSVDDLKNIAISAIGQSVDLKEIEILSVNYFPVQSGFAALIDYSVNGLKGNFAYSDYEKIGYSASSLESKSAGAQNKEVTVKCNGTCNCLVEGVNKPDGTITFGCSCTDCTATINYP